MPFDMFFFDQYVLFFKYLKCLCLFQTTCEFNIESTNGIKLTSRFYRETLRVNRKPSRRVGLTLSKRWWSAKEVKLSASFGPNQVLILRQMEQIKQTSLACRTPTAMFSSSEETFGCCWSSAWSLWLGSAFSLWQQQTLKVEITFIKLNSDSSPLNQINTFKGEKYSLKRSKLHKLWSLI